MGLDSGTTEFTRRGAYSAQYRLDGLKALADSVEALSVLCLDQSFLPVPLPPEISSLGVTESLNSMGGGRYLQAIDSRDHRVISSQIRVAQTRGIGGARVRLSESVAGHNAEVAIQIFDLTEQHGVFIFAVGLFEPRWGGEVVASTAEIPTRILCHKANGLGQFTEVDARNRDVVGWSPEEIVGNTGLDLIHELDRDRAIDSWLQAIGGQDGIRQRCRHLTKSGEYKWIEFTYYNRLDSDDGGYMGVETLDVDKEMLALARAKVGASKFETLAKSLPVGVVQLDLNGELVFANKWVRAMTEVDTAMMASDQLLGSLHEDDIPEMRRAFQRCLRLEEVDVQLRLRNFRTEEFRLCLVRARPLIMDGEIFGVMASLEDVTESTSVQTHLRNQAMTDHLTGLPNRAALTERLQELIESQERVAPEFACLFVDLDGFKLINDGLGHEAGDQLLVTIGERLKSVIRPGDIVARVGGDEFVVLCAWGATEADIVRLAERLMATVQKPILVGNVPATVGASIGIALQGGSDITADVIISNADMAMYEAKRSGGARWALFGEELRESMTRRFDLQTSLYEALKNNEFRMHLQPLWDLNTDEVIGAEALVRWYHPTKGEIPPGHFIPFAAESDLMVPLGWWIINDCCRIAAAVIASGAPNFRLGVNVTGGQLSEPGFADKFLATMEQHGLHPRNLVMEITETVWIDDGPQINNALQALSAAGVDISLDDFGTGYSSLNHVRDMPVKSLKIDYSYTSKLETCSSTRAIIEAIQDLAAKLGLKIVVEGIETDAQLEIVKGMGLRIGQGYLMARPCDEETFLAQYAPRIAQRTTAFDR